MIEPSGNCPIAGIRYGTVSGAAVWKRISSGRGLCCDWVHADSNSADGIAASTKLSIDLKFILMLEVTHSGAEHCDAALV